MLTRRRCCCEPTEVCGIQCSSCPGVKIPTYVRITDDNGTWTAGPPEFISGLGWRWTARDASGPVSARDNRCYPNACAAQDAGDVTYWTGLVCTGATPGFKIFRSYSTQVTDFGLPTARCCSGHGFDGGGDPIPVVYCDTPGPTNPVDGSTCPACTFSTESDLFTISDCVSGTGSGTLHADPFNPGAAADPWGSGVSVSWAGKLVADYVCCLPAPIPRRNLTASFGGPGGSGSATANYSGGSWSTGCVDRVVFRLACTDGAIVACADTFAPGDCPGGARDACCSDVSGLVLANVRPDPFHLHYTVGAACTALLAAGITDVYFDE